MADGRPGPKAKPAAERKTVSLTIPLSEADAAKITARAEKAGVSKTEWARDVLMIAVENAA